MGKGHIGVPFDKILGPFSDLVSDRLSTNEIQELCGGWSKGAYVTRGFLTHMRTIRTCKRCCYLRIRESVCILVKKKEKRKIVYFWCCV